MEESHAKRLANGEHTDTPRRKKLRVFKPRSKPLDKQAISRPAPKLEGALKPITKTKTALDKLVLRTDPGLIFSSSSRSQREREDDAYIGYLEAKLRKGKKSTDDDGLDGESALQLINLLIYMVSMIIVQIY
jgi:hypothetical protein